MCSPIKNSCLQACVRGECTLWIPHRTAVQHEQQHWKMGPVSNLEGGRLSDFERSNCSGMEALVFLMICAAFYFAGTIKDSDVFWYSPEAVNPFSCRKKRNVNRWLCTQPVAFIIWLAVSQGMPGTLRSKKKKKKSDYVESIKTISQQNTLIGLIKRYA